MGSGEPACDIRKKNRHILIENKEEIKNFKLHRLRIIRKANKIWVKYNNKMLSKAL